MTVRNPVAVVEKSKAASPGQSNPGPSIPKIFQTDSHTWNNLKATVANTIAIFFPNSQPFRDFTAKQVIRFVSVIDGTTELLA
jgi:hypothetical protein